MVNGRNMKSMNGILTEKYTIATNEKALTNTVAEAYNFKDLEYPTISTEMACPLCGCKEFFTCMAQMFEGDTRKAWCCAEPSCLAYRASTYKGATNIQPIPRSTITWANLCEIWGLGDLMQQVRFENIQQNDAKLKFLAKFAASPKGIAFFTGEPGTGKTYAALGVCEYFCRSDSSCWFTSGKKMIEDWIKSKDGTYNEKMREIKLLVIDDFATGELNSSFLAFFMDLISHRMQWSKKGTIITTNLESQKILEICGKALVDRLTTGQTLLFKDQSRRKPII